MTTHTMSKGGIDFKGELRKVKENRGWILAYGLAMTVLGLLALSAPFVTSLAVGTIIGVFMLIGAGINIVHSFKAKGVGNALWYVLIAALYGVGGAYLLLNPVEGIVALSMVLAIFFLIEGATRTILAIQLRKMTGSGWILFNGIVSIVLGAIVLSGYPESGLWFLGVLFGVNLLMTGISSTALAFSLKD